MSYFVMSMIHILSTKTFLNLRFLDLDFTKLEVSVHHSRGDLYSVLVNELQ